MSDSTKQIAERISERCAGFTHSKVSFSASDLKQVADEYLALRMELKPPVMDSSYAHRIVSKCIMHVYYREGVVDEKPPSLEGLSLAELLEANHLVGGDAGRRKNEDGTESIAMHCEDRLVAALYALYHYEACEQDAIEPIVFIDGKALCCVRTEVQRSR